MFFITNINEIKNLESFHCKAAIISCFRQMTQDISSVMFRFKLNHMSHFQITIV